MSRGAASPGDSIRPVALLSGASRGIGLSIARELLEAGWRLSAGSRSPIGALEGYPAKDYLWSPFDAQDSATEDEWIARTVAHFGGIDAIVHNAGILSSSSVVQTSDEEFDQVFTVNVKSPLRVTRKAWPHLIQSRRGRVIVIASLAGKRMRTADAGLYAMSKAAALMLAHGIRHSGEAHNIRCTAICPGFVATDMAATVPDQEKMTLTQPDDIARIVRFALELPASASVAEIPVSWRVESMF